MAAGARSGNPKCTRRLVLFEGFRDGKGIGSFVFRRKEGKKRNLSPAREAAEGGGGGGDLGGVDPGGGRDSRLLLIFGT